MDKHRFVPPKPSTGDLAHSGAKALLGFIPGFGGAAAELLPWLVAAPWAKRHQQWMESVGEALADLIKSKGINPEELKNNSVFVDTVLHATQVAQRTSQAEKREALRNAVLNSALPNSIDEIRQQIFSNLVDALTSWHLKILKLFHDPKKWFEEKRQAPPEFYFAGSLNQLLLKAYPELEGQRGMYDQLAKDLYSRGLLNTDGLHAMGTGSGMWADRTTELGKQFLVFISEPIQSR